MPQYSYKCSNEACSKIRDLTAKSEDRNAWQGKPCPTCGNGELRRVFTPFNTLPAGLGDIV